MLDKDTFCENIRICEKAMYYTAFSIVGNESDASDIISESVYRAYKSVDTLKNKNAFKPWVLRIVHNTAVETIRKNKIIPSDKTSDISNDDLENSILTKLTVGDAVSGLKQPYRTVILLFYYENLSISKIAQITGTNTATVKKQLSRARNMLREILKEDFGK